MGKAIACSWVDRCQRSHSLQQLRSNFAATSQHFPRTETIDNNPYINNNLNPLTMKLIKHTIPIMIIAICVTLSLIIILPDSLLVIIGCWQIGRWIGHLAEMLIEQLDSNE